MNTITQVERGGLFEISEATLAELKSSKYYNDDLAPTSISERSWTTYSITMLWVGMSICIPSLSLASGLIAMGVSPWLSVLNVALGNIIILVPIQLNSQIGTKYGIPFPLFARLTFGTLGAQIPALLRAITACGWTSVQAWVGGGAVGAMIGAFVPKFADEGWTIGLPSVGRYPGIRRRSVLRHPADRRETSQTTRCFADFPRSGAPRQNPHPR